MRDRLPRSGSFRIPDFFIVGAGKSGTTSLYQYLIQHPSVFMPLNKEPHFFAERPGFTPLFKDLESYLSIFAACPEGAVAGEASTSYLPSPTAAHRIHEVQPKARIIMVLRNPVDRAYSLYWYNRKRFKETLSFEDALAAEEERARKPKRLLSFRIYVESGMYYEQVMRYLRTFGNDSVKVYLFEDLKIDGGAICRSTFQFLGVDPDFPVDTDRIHNPSGEYKYKILGRTLRGHFPGRSIVRKLTPRRLRHRMNDLMDRNLLKPPEMNPDTRAALVERFRQDVERLQSLLNRDLSHWLTVP
jgi:hypothetical protein